VRPGGLDGIRWRGDGTDADCPLHGEDGPPQEEHVQRVAVACAVLAVWPQERDAMEDFEGLLRPRCDWFAAFVALEPRSADGEGLADDAQFPVGWSVIDLVAVYPELVEPDRWASAPNSNQKFHAMVRYMDDHVTGKDAATELSPPDGRDWWSCPLETDVYFVPENFRRLVALRGLNTSSPLWLGGPRLHALQTDGAMLEPLLASCLSSEAVSRLAQLVRGYVAAQGRRDAPVRIQAWPLTSHWCEPLRASAHTEIMEIVNACLRAVGVYPPDPRLVHDRRGRAYFPLWALDVTGRAGARPPLADLDVAARAGGEAGLAASMRVAWKGREHLYAACMRAGQRVWAADYPIVFHPHIRPKLGVRQRGRMNVTKRWLAPSAVDGILRRGETCPRRLCGSYQPRVHNSAAG